MTVGRTFLHGARRLLLAFAGSYVLWCMACSVYASTPDAETREGLAADSVQKAIDECRMVLEQNFNGVNA